MSRTSDYNSRMVRIPINNDGPSTSHASSTTNTSTIVSPNVDSDDLVVPQLVTNTESSSEMSSGFSEDEFGRYSPLEEIESELQVPAGYDLVAVCSFCAKVIPKSEAIPLITSGNSAETDLYNKTIDMLRFELFYTDHMYLCERCLDFCLGFHMLKKGIHKNNCILLKKNWDKKVKSLLFAVNTKEVLRVLEKIKEECESQKRGSDENEVDTTSRKRLKTTPLQDITNGQQPTPSTSSLNRASVEGNCQDEIIENGADSSQLTNLGETMEFFITQTFNSSNVPMSPQNESAPSELTGYKCNKCSSLFETIASFNFHAETCFLEGNLNLEEYCQNENNDENSIYESVEESFEQNLNEDEMGNNGNPDLQLYEEDSLY